MSPPLLLNQDHCATKNARDVGLEEDQAKRILAQNLLKRAHRLEIETCVQIPAPKTP